MTRPHSLSLVRAAIALAHLLREKSLVVAPPSLWKKRTLPPEQKGAAWSIGSRVLQTSCIHAWKKKKKTSAQRFIASSHLRLMSTEGKDPCFCFLLGHPKTKTFTGKGDTKDPLDPPGQVPLCILNACACLLRLHLTVKEGPNRAASILCPGMHRKRSFH